MKKIDANVFLRYVLAGYVDVEKDEVFTFNDKLKKMIAKIKL
jgi:pyoverdine/dityrosine biosynthesis protein Dit1